MVRLDPGSPANPGLWFDPTVEACHGLTALPPYGLATVESGVIKLSASLGARAVPYLASRLPSDQPPFPRDGDFVLTIRIRYDHISGCGTGIFVIPWADTSPTGDNASVSATNVVFQIWGDGSGVTLSTSLGGTYEHLSVAIPNQEAFHQYAVRCEGGAYRFLVDGQTVFGPVENTLRPSAIWMGNPIFSYSGCEDWSAFSVDYVRVESVGATRASSNSWGTLKIRYR